MLQVESLGGLVEPHKLQSNIRRNLYLTLRESSTVILVCRRALRTVLVNKNRITCDRAQLKVELLYVVGAREFGEQALPALVVDQDVDGERFAVFGLILRIVNGKLVCNGGRNTDREECEQGPKCSWRYHSTGYYHFRL